MTRLGALICLRKLGNKVYLQVQFWFHQKTNALTVVNEIILFLYICGTKKHICGYDLIHIRFRKLSVTCHTDSE